MKVFCYYNLHRDTWSIKALEGPDKGRVILHADHVLLEHATPKVSEKGRQRVLREKRKNVHAGIVGTLVSTLKLRHYAIPEGAPEVSYNPYKGSTFYYKASGEAWATQSEFVLLTGKKVYLI